MPSLVNRVPPGLLSLLGIKALGVNPSVLPDELQPTLDITDLYRVGNSELVGGTTSSITAPGAWTLGAGLVPAGELWVVNRFACYFTANLAAGTVYRLRPAIYDSPNQRILALGDQASGTAGERPSAGFPEPFVLTSGEQLAVWCEAFTAGTAAGVRIDARITRLSI